VVLNFAPVEGYPIEPLAISREFDPRSFIIKFTPLNPTQRSKERDLKPMIGGVEPSDWEKVVGGFRELGFETILSIGDLEENRIGSNCGQYVQRMPSL
jgi:23S rRNA (adenine2503-C2)-methyltransferase